MRNRVVTASLLGGILIGAAPRETTMPSAESANAFAFDLYREIRKTPGNQVVSPWSLSMALTMAWGGAGGATAQEMAALLHVSGPPERLLKESGALAASLTEPGPVTFRVANRLYGEKTYRFETAYLETVRAAFGAPLEPVDFRGAAEPARVRINSWVEDQTEKRIRNLIPRGGVDDTTRLVLVNALYFLGDWREPFNERATRAAPFHVSKTVTKDVPTMHRGGGMRFVHDAAGGVRAVELPYKGDRLAMLVVLPDAVDGLPALEEGLTAARFARLVGRLAHATVSVALPRFQIDPKEPLSLAGTLAGMGMPSAFDPGRADFTGIARPADPRDRLSLSAVFHKAFVKVNELGTEAAAASALSLRAGSAAPARVEPFTADHPFLFFIRDTKTGLVVFMGRVADPPEAD